MAHVNKMELIKHGGGLGIYVGQQSGTWRVIWVTARRRVLSAPFDCRMAAEQYALSYSID